MLIWINFGDWIDFLHQFTPCNWFSDNHRFYYAINIRWVFISNVSVLLNKQRIRILALDIVEIVPNSVNGTKNYQITLATRI